MINLIRGEYYKLIKNKVFIQIMLLAILFGSLLVIFFDRNIVMFTNEVNKLGMKSLNYSFSSIIFCSFLFSIFAVQFIVDDFKSLNGTKVFAYGYKRSKVVLSKFIVYILTSLVLICIYTAILVLYVIFEHKFGTIDILYIMRTIIIGILYNLATISIIGMIAFLSQNTLVTLISPIIFLLCVVMKANGMSILVYLPFIIGVYASEMFRPGYNYNLIVMGSLISVVITFIITTSVSVYKIKKQNFK